MTSLPAFVALEPDPGLADLICQAKAIVRELAGAQRYLDEPPHLTLVVNSFPDLDEVAQTLASLARSQSPLRVDLDGWHVFRNDPLTGGHTVVADPAPSGKSALRHLQDRVLEVTAPRRDQEASTARFRPFFGQLSPTRQNSVLRWGFPFTGADWNPHVSVASIAPAVWKSVWVRLETLAPRLAATFGELVLYRLECGQVPVRVQAFPLEAS